MSKIIDRAGSGAAITTAENDANLDSLHGINQVVAGTTFTVDITDQGDTIEFTSASAVAVTLDDIATILAAAHTTSFHVTLIATGAGTVTITPDASDSINTGAATIVLTTDMCVTIETDSTGAIWNIVNYSNVDIATKTGTETLTNKTLTDPVMNGAATGTAIGRGALVNNSAPVTISNNTWTHVAWDTEAYDTDTIHDTVSNTERLTVPAGVTLVRLKALIVFETNGTGTRIAQFSKNDVTTTPTAFVGGSTDSQEGSASVVSSLLLVSAPITVVATDYFSVGVFQTSGGNLDILATNPSWFAMEIIK